MRERIRPPKDLEPVLDELKESGVIETKQKGMMLAAGLGYALKSDLEHHLPPERYGEGIRLEYFQRVQDDGFIDALAVAAKESLEVLSAENNDDRLNIFEGYANTGLWELKRRMDAVRNKTGTDFLDVVIDILDDMGRGGEGESATDAKVRRLEGLV